MPSLTTASFWPIILGGHIMRITKLEKATAAKMTKAFENFRWTVHEQYD
jgi:hypothetical protein